MQPPSPLPPVPSVSVLIVDDDPNIRMMVALILQEEGYLVRTAANGAEGIAAVRQDCPDLVVLDMRMPVLDGWGFAAQLQECDLHPKILVLAAALNVGVWAREIQADDYLPKPFILDTLLEKVAHLCAAA